MDVDNQFEWRKIDGVCAWPLVASGLLKDVSAACWAGCGSVCLSHVWLTRSHPAARPTGGFFTSVGWGFLDVVIET